MKQQGPMNLSSVLKKMRPVWFLSLLLVSIFFPDLSSGCCCNVIHSCRCNMFACNCDTDDGWCYKELFYSKPSCVSSKGTARAEYCPNRRRRKRSVSLAISQAYSGLYSRLIERDAMENFLTFDLNWDGLISLEEAMETRGNNDTTIEFKQVDVDNDGYVHPSEFDQSLV